ncbi:T9SS type A sorting domain-containing protein [Gelidibacter sp. F2691]|nr:T9SS type A sorting domain-containing protein [Gelidibacter sp. F2691]
MKNYYLLLLTLLLTGLSFGQSTIYSEQFNDQSGRGATGGLFGPNINLSGVNWTVNVNDANLSWGFFGWNRDYFYVSNNRFTSKDTDGNAIWYSPSINISNYNDVNFSLDVTSGGNNENNDSFKTQYRLNNSGAWLTDATNGNLINDVIGTINVSKTGLSSNFIQIRVIINTNQDDDIYSFDNVIVKGVLKSCTQPENVSNLTATSGDSQVRLNWSNSLCSSQVMVVARRGSAVTASPNGNGNNYNANAVFGNGTQIKTNEFVVYKGSGTTINVTGLTNGQIYHFRVYTRIGNTWSVGVPIDATPLGYCIPTANPGNFRTSIRFVQFGAINNPTERRIIGGPGYQNYTSQVTEATIGSTMPLNVRVDTDGQYNVITYAWIDWNRNGVFSNDERYNLGTTYDSNNGVTSNSPLAIVIPIGASLGATRMRVITQFYSTLIPEINPCVGPTDGETEDYTVVITEPLPITYVYNNGWLPSDPIGLSTPIDTIIIENGEAVFNYGNTYSNTITVNPTGAITIKSGATLSSDNGMILESNSTQYASLILDGVLTGEVYYNRHVNGYQTVGKGAGGNDLISAPLSGQKFGEFAAGNANIYANPNQPTQKLFGPFSKITGSYLTWDAGAQSNEILTAGVGYRAASTDNEGFVFTGIVAKDEVPVNILNSGAHFQAYNLVGNPYPSYLNVVNFLTYQVDPIAGVRNIDLMDNFGAIYGYDGDATGAGGSGWITYNLTSGTLPGNDVNITPGQGFLVTADVTKVAAYDMTFAPSMRRVGTTDDFIQGRPVNQNAAHIKLQAAIGTSLLKTDIFFIEGTTSGLDFGYDAAIYGRKAPAQALYSQLVENHTGVDLSIQSLAYSALESDITVPVGINVPQGQQVTVSIAETSLPENVEVYLEDTENGSFTLLNDTDYVFTSTSKLSNAGRFYLRFSAKTLSVEDNEVNGLRIFTTATPRALHIKGLLTATTTVTVYDLQGRLVVSSILDEGSQANKVDVSGLSVGAYIVKLSNASQQKTQKVILK